MSLKFLQYRYVYHSTIKHNLLQETHIQNQLGLELCD